MNIEKQLIDQRITKILQDNSALFSADDEERRRSKAFLSDINIQAFRPYSQHFMAAMLGKQLLQTHHIDLASLTHKNFSVLKKEFDEHKDALYDKVQAKLTEILTMYFNTDALYLINGRTMSAAFRRFDLVEDYLKNEKWWDMHMRG